MTCSLRGTRERARLGHKGTGGSRYFATADRYTAALPAASRSSAYMSIISGNW